ncbi:MAG: hypothetical protein A2W86_10815 [Bacteroidetes bacterium GWD2_45_23]|nr:MAG: hypothetical protein A2W87_10770 [Bacteroidetes bacterium GWC2_46_850]OFX73833.1 MAG: hypothetical protein A2071_02480 [Bacteroidetes bacterium GWC1_47_7]OFX85099.1 MAG: hypothetical protein A2W86_10815 [Bacteroidetes bacterium GWD2_45_23]HAR39113.1 hypothetical protein [Porphyromonadaceae bacterium]HBB00420.1 hypothetical protein [Porphyromonadaceae bacterium]
MKIIVKILAFFLFLISIESCEDFMDIHQEYLEGGEIIYAPKPDSVAFIAGRNRVMFKGWVYNGVNIDKLIVRWNSGLDSISIPVTFNNEMDSIDVIIDNLPEKSYTFDVYSIDNFGHRSLTITNFGSSYSDIYLSTLIPRRIKSISLTDKEGMIEWFTAAEGLIGNEIRYIMKSDGSTGIAFMEAGKYNIAVDVKAGSEFEHRSLYIPEEQAIDTFYTEWVKHPDPFPSIYQYNKDEWEVLQVSDEKASDGGGMHTIIDNNLNNYWHSQWGPNIPLPHWAIIDMQSTKTIAFMEVYRRKNSTDTKTVQIFLSNDPDPESLEWVLAGEGQYTTGDKLRVDVTPGSSGRYMKIYLPDSNRDPFTNVAEVYVYGN